jgi:hypothetical protein
MLERRPDLPEFMEGGLENPLGARALYLHQGGRDTLYRIHGTNEPNTGKAVSSGCIRLLNEDVFDLYNRVPVGTVVKVYPAGPRRPPRGEEADHDPSEESATDLLRAYTLTTFAAFVAAVLAKISDPAADTVSSPYGGSIATKYV